jgi:hypothetical protein
MLVKGDSAGLDARLTEKGLLAAVLGYLHDNFQLYNQNSHKNSCP